MTHGFPKNGLGCVFDTVRNEANLKMCDPIEIIQAYCDPDSLSHAVLLRHGRQVARKAAEVAGNVPDLQPDLAFIQEAAMLHDIGMLRTNTPTLGCTGRYPYLFHGILGRALLEERGLARHALVCARHVGVGIGIADIRKYNLGLPERDMAPVTLEEQIICYADKFFSKSAIRSGREKTVDEIICELATYGEDKVKRFMAWTELFDREK